MCLSKRIQIVFKLVYFFKFNIIPIQIQSTTETYSLCMLHTGRGFSYQIRGYFRLKPFKGAQRASDPARFIGAVKENYIQNVFALPCYLPVGFSQQIGYF